MVDGLGGAKVIDGILTIVVSLATYSIIKVREKIDMLSDRLTTAEAEKISEDKARKIVSKEIGDIRTTLEKIAETVTLIRIEQAKEQPSLKSSLLTSSPP